VRSVNKTLTDILKNFKKFVGWDNPVFMPISQLSLYDGKRPAQTTTLL